MRRKAGAGAVIRTVIWGEKRLIFGLISVMSGAVVFALLPPLVLEQIVNQLTGGQAVTGALSFLYFGLLAAAGLFEAAQQVLITIFGQKVTRGFRHQMCAKLSRLPAAYFSKNEAGKITSRFVNDVDTVDSLFTDGIISMCADGCKVCGVLVMIFFKSTGLGLLMILVTPLLFWMTRAFQTRMLKAQLSNRVAVEKVNNHIPETIQNIRMIHSLFRQKYMEQRYDDYIQESYRAVEKSNLYDSVYSPIVIFISSCVIAAMMVLSAMGGGLQSFFGMTVGTAVAIIAYVGMVFEPIESIGMEIQNIQSALAGISRINEFLQETERKEQDPSLTCEKLTASAESCVRFDHVRFAYEQDVPVLNDLTFSVDMGQSATLVGRTGAGKSTAFRLLLGLYSPDSGRVKVYGQDADAIPDSEKRNLFGYVEQPFHPVSGTVSEQITMFDPTITEERIARAAKLVGLQDSILALEKGYDTPVNDSLFSQGQFQLLSIARAIAADPAIMLLDEMTANLDSDTERRVIDALKRASENRTVLSISHRLYEMTLQGKLIPVAASRCRGDGGLTKL